MSILDNFDIPFSTYGSYLSFHYYDETYMNAPDIGNFPVPKPYQKGFTLRPVCGMQSGGTHEQIAGTWLDDTSMTLCMMKAIISKGIDYIDQMERFADWLWNATNTSHDEVFDVGGSTKMSIFKNTGGNSRLLVSEMKIIFVA